MSKSSINYPWTSASKQKALSPARSVTGLILSGGGARAAYQVGVLKAIADLCPSTENPFQVIVGTSAGAINAVSLACGALDYTAAIQGLERVWQSFTTDKVYRTDWLGVLRQASAFTTSHVLGWGRRHAPLALLDNAPLRDLLAEELDFSGISLAIARRKLRAVAVTAFAYQSAQATTFYQSRGTLLPWQRHRRLGVPTRLGIEHLMASAAIPLLFPPVRLGQEFYGDGAVRQTAPLSPALHLGANRIMVIGVHSRYQQEPSRLQLNQPSLAQISGHLLSSTFSDNLESDLELLGRLNQLGGLIPSEYHHVQEGLAPVEVLLIQPSKVIDEIAVRHRHQLPASIRLFLKGSGATRTTGGGGVLSYLLFEQDYCAELIELGYQDAVAQKHDILAFLQLTDPKL